MKKNIILIIMGMFIFCTTSNVLAQESYYYKNKNDVLFSYENYKFISEFFFEGYQEYMSQEDYNVFISSNIMNGEIVINDTSSQSTRTIDFLETNMKKLKIASSCSDTCFIATTLTWKTNPTIRSYDHIGAVISNTSFVGSTDFRMYSGNSIVNPVFTNKISNGIDAIFKLPKTNEEISIINTFTINRKGTVNVSYQHAKNTISLSKSKKYSFSTNGYGGVYKFDSTVKSYYDAMSGLTQSY